jgi:hypothetical protein
MLTTRGPPNGPSLNLTTGSVTNICQYSRKSDNDGQFTRTLMCVYVHITCVFRQTFIAVSNANLAETFEAHILYQYAFFSQNLADFEIII